MATASVEELRFLGPGFNWMKIQGMIAVGIGGYDSPLPAGTKVSVVTFDPGKACMEGPLLVAHGEVDTAITPPPWFARMALEGKGYFSSPVPLRALARFLHFDQLAFAVTRRSGRYGAAGDFREKNSPARLHRAAGTSGEVGHRRNLESARMVARGLGTVGRQSRLRRPPARPAGGAQARADRRRVGRSADDGAVEDNYGRA